MVENLPQLKEKQMLDNKFLLEELFTKHTKYGKLPSSYEEFLTCYSQREYETILQEVLFASGLLEEGE